jgi:hypothetical protein
MPNDIESQIQKEAEEIANAPKIPVSQLQPHDMGNSGRCSFCGRISGNLVLVEVIHGQERYAGECCRPSR